MSEEPEFAMKNANFTLICSDGEKIGVNREKLCAFSEVFDSILSMPVDGSDDSCGVAETGAEMRLLLPSIESPEEENWNWDAIRRLTSLAEKYDMPQILIALKLDIAKHIIRDEVREDSYEAAVNLSDDILACGVLSKNIALVNSLREDKEEGFDASWKYRATSYLDQHSSAVQKALLNEAKKLIDGTRICSKHAVDEKLLLRAMVLAKDNPGCAPSEMFFKALGTRTYECANCLQSLLNVSRHLVEDWPAIEKEWKGLF